VSLDDTMEVRGGLKEIGVRCLANAINAYFRNWICLGFKTLQYFFQVDFQFDF
jgi:hypothetical protein